MRRGWRWTPLVALGLATPISHVLAQPVPPRNEWVDAGATDHDGAANGPKPHGAPSDAGAPSEIDGSAPARSSPLDAGALGETDGSAPPAKATPTPVSARPKAASVAKEKDPPPEKKPSSYRFSRFTWGNSASTKIFGIGESYQGTEDSVYTMDFTLNLRYYFWDSARDTAYVNATGGVTTELTNSDTTRTIREPIFKDMSLAVGYGHTLFQGPAKGTKTIPGGSFAVILPTSHLSQDQGKYFSLNLSGFVMQSIELRGAKAHWFPDILIFGSGTYTHLFSRGYMPTNESLLSLPRQTLDGTMERSDQVSMSSFAIDTAKLGLTYYLTIYGNLSFGNTWELDIPFSHSFPKSTISLPTGIETIGGSALAPNPTTTFDVSFSYLWFDTVRFDIGYVNATPELQDNAGKRRNVFYGPEALFYTNVVLYFDGLAERVWPLVRNSKAP